MSASPVDAKAHLAAIRIKHGLDSSSNLILNQSCHFAYVKKNLPPNSYENAVVCVVLEPNGDLTPRRISLVTYHMLAHNDPDYHYLGIALMCVNPSTNIPKKIKVQNESPLVADLRVAMAEGKFASFITPSSK